MRFKSGICVGAIWVIFIVFSSLLAGGSAWGQSSLAINYTSLSMGCGGSQNLSASGGCPPYNWSLSGGGGFGGAGSNVKTATGVLVAYASPSTNANCSDNPTITCTDYCGNSTSITLAINCVTGGGIAHGIRLLTPICCYAITNPNCAGQSYNYSYFLETSEYMCDGSLFSYTTFGGNPCPAPPCTNFCPCTESDGCWPPLNCGPTSQVNVGCGCYFNAPWLQCNTMTDLRSYAQKQAGCCPINPQTGLPFDAGNPNNEDQNAGNPGCIESVSDPTNIATGNKYEEVLDLSISTPGIPFEFRRSYNSQIFLDGPLGYRWTHTYGMSVGVVQTSPTTRVRIWDSDGRALYFDQVQQTSTEILFGGESGVKDRLTQVVSTGQYILRRKEGNLSYTFGSDGKLQTISDANGNTLTMTYTGGLLTQVANNFGKAITIHYTNNHIDSITDPNGRSISYQNTNGDLIQVTYPDTNSISYAYSSHDLTDKYDTNNNLIGHWGYDNRHRVINNYRFIENGVHQEEINLTYQSGSTLVTDSRGTTNYTTGVINSIYVAQEIQGCSTCGSPHRQFQYSNQLDLTDVTSIDDSNGTAITTHYTYDTPANPYDEVGDILSMTEALMNPVVPEQRTTSYTYTHRTDDPFLLTQSTETISSVAAAQQNKVITTAYDNQGNILSRQEAGYVLINGVATPKTYTTAYQYNTLGQLTQIDGPRTDVSDITTIQYYANTSDQGNNQGQLKAIVNALGQSTQFSNYDANGNVGTITDPNGVIIQRTYDQRNRIKTITNQTTGAQTQYFYDSHGNLSYIILPEGNQISFTYDLANRLTAIQDSLGNKIQYQYDVEGNRTHEEVDDPQGVLKKYLDFTYDAYNRLQTIVNPDTSYTGYTYDGIGNIIASKDPKNNTTAYAYDALRRIKQTTQPLTTITGYGYDTQNNQASVTDPNGNTTQYWSDDFGRRNQVNSADTGITDYLYDEAGNLLQRFDAKETVVNYTYDALNRLTAIQFPSDANQNVTFTYDSTSVTYGIGRLTGRTDPSGSYTFYYDAQGNLTREDKTINSVLYTTQYTYNKNNALTSVTYPSGRTITYTLDGVGRINQVGTTLNGNPKTLASAITYLPYGGITGLTYGNGLYLTQGYNNQYRISSIVTGSILNLAFGYDPNGNITSILDTVNPPGGEVLETPGGYSYQQGTNKLTHIEGTLPIDYGYDANGNITTENTWTYVYDLSNQLVCVQNNGTTVAEYVYNGIGQRIKKNSQGSVKVFHYNYQGYLISETTETGQTLVEYIYIGNNLLAKIQGEQVYYYHNDHLGTSQILTDDSGNIAWKAVYTPFGEAQVVIETVTNPFRLIGQYYDQETGLHYNYFRYYDPKTGRYVTPDPLGLEGGMNLFAFVANNPMNMTDRLGLATYIELPSAGSPGRYWWDFGGGISDFWRNYWNMRNANTIGADKYFHCMANCEASRRGLGGSDAARLISETRELFDEYIKGDPRWACDQDRAANRQGQQGDPTKSCGDVCKSLRPRGLNPKY